MNATQRGKVIAEIRKLADQAIFGTLSETYRCCGNPGCRCHTGGPKHGPHLYVSYRGPSGKTTGYYVPQGVQKPLRRGVAAWARLQECLGELAMANKERLFPRPRPRAKPEKPEGHAKA